jgi:hypothetical protein
VKWQLSPYYNTGVTPVGPRYQDVVALGNRAYVLASSLSGAFDEAVYWLDTYDITNPLQPQWLASTGVPVCFYQHSPNLTANR